MTLLTFIACHALLMCANLTNSLIDSHRILVKNKRIYHGVNGTVYFAITCLLFYFFEKPDFTWSGFPFLWLFVFLVSSFCNRQLTFDIPLNLLRGLSWDYVSTEKPPKSITDRIEIFIFGYNGSKQAFIYFTVLAWCFVIKLFI